MKVRIRVPAIIFAIFSAGYWAGIQAFWMGLSNAYCEAYRHRPPVIVGGIVGGAPMAIYAATCVFFCHWLARRVIRQSLAQGIN